MFISESDGITVNTKFTIDPTSAETKKTNTNTSNSFDPLSKTCSESNAEIDRPKLTMTNKNESNAPKTDKTGHKSHFADFPMSCSLRKFRDKFGMKKAKDAIEPSVLQTFCATICAI